MGSMESTINVGSQPWHGTLPANWVPIVARDVNRQNDRDAIQAASRPLSDALLSTQSAKRRRLASKSKPEGNVEQLIADTLHSAMGYLTAGTGGVGNKRPPGEPGEATPPTQSAGRHTKLGRSAIQMNALCEA